MNNLFALIASFFSELPIKGKWSAFIGFIIFFIVGYFIYMGYTGINNYNKFDSLREISSLPV